MTWFMDTVPDGDTVHQVGQSFRDAHASYTASTQQVQTTHATTITVWAGPGSDVHTQTTGKTQQVAQQHAGWLIALADTFSILGTILKLIFVLQMVWLAIQAGTALWAIFTAGLDALVTEGPAAALAVVIQGLRQGVAMLLQALARTLASEVVRAGAVIGGTIGLGVGVKTVEDNHLSGWQAVLTVVGDTATGAFAGMTVAANPTALAGTGIGIGQTVTQDALGNTISAQDAFDTTVFDTFVVAGLDDFAPDSNPDAMYAKDGKGGRGTPKPGPITTDANMPPGMKNPISQQYIDLLTKDPADGGLGLRVEWNDDAQVLLQKAKAKGAVANYNPVNLPAGQIGNTDYVAVFFRQDATNATVYEEYLHAQRAMARNWADLPPWDTEAGVIARCKEEIEVEWEVLQNAQGLNMSNAQFDAINQGRMDNYLNRLKGIYLKHHWKWPPTNMDPKYFIPIDNPGGLP